jgi:hypothetical protein
LTSLGIYKAKAGATVRVCPLGRKDVQVKRFLSTIVAFAMLAPAAMASAHFLHVSPHAVTRGNRVTVSGSVGNGCETGHAGDVATIFSRAFKGSTSQNFAGVPAVFASLRKHDTFSFKIRIRKSIKKGTYNIGGRCGGGNFGSVTLKVS